MAEVQLARRTKLHIQEDAPGTLTISEAMSAETKNGAGHTASRAPQPIGVLGGGFAEN